MKPILVALMAVVAISAAPVHAQWRYSSKKDPMTDRMIQRAWVISKNSYNLSFPYHGGTRARLSVFNAADGDLRVRFDIDRGQLVCGIDDCEVTMRFDNDPPRTFTAVGPSDHSTDTLFLEPEATILAALKTAKRVRLQATFYQSGNLTFEFNTANLKWSDD